MGYYISTPNTHFAIRTADLPKFFDLVAHLMKPENVEKYGNGGSYHNMTKTAAWYSWVDHDNVQNAIENRNIVEVFNGWGYELDFLHEQDEISYYRLDIRNGSAKIGEEEKFFAAIAPVVVDGSYVDCSGEDGDRWRWMWEDGKFFTQAVMRIDTIYDEPVEISIDLA
jgi:hypothetical protein